MTRKMKSSGAEWIGDIPEEWGAMFAFQCFEPVKSRNLGMTETNLLSLSYGKIKRKSIETTEGLLPESFETYNVIEKDDIVLRLTDLQNDHKSLRVGLSNEKGIITSAYLTLRNKSANVSKYLYYYLHSFDLAKGFYSMGAGVRQGLNWDELKHLIILKPDVNEQEIIVSHIDSQCYYIDSIIEKTKASIEEYKKLKQTIITQAVTKGVCGTQNLKDSNIPWIGEISLKYNVLKLKYLLKTQLQYGANQTGIPYSKDLPRYIRITDISSDGKLKNDGLLSLNEEDAENFILQNNDILFARSGGTVGKAFIYKSAYGRAAFAGYLIRACLQDTCKPDYLFYYTQSSIYEEWKNQIFIQSTIQNIGADRYSEMPIVIPPTDEQEEIVKYLDYRCSDIDRLIETKHHIIDELESYKRSMIYEYVTGKKEVRV